MILINKFTELKGLTHSQFYKLSVELKNNEIGYGAKPNKKDNKKIDILVKVEDLTDVITLLAKIKTLNSEV